MTNEICVKCRTKNLSNATHCVSCKAPLNVSVTSPSLSTPSFSSQTSSMNPSSVSYYKHSNKFSVGGLVAAVIASITAAVLLSFIYAYLVYYLPFVYLNFICTIGFAVIVGSVTGVLLETGKVRNSFVATFAGFFVSLVALYCAWAVWVYALLSSSQEPVALLDVFTNPFALWETILFINQVGAWSFKGSTPTGAALWVVWGIEAAAIIGGINYTVWSAISSDKAFCERCNKWCDAAKGALITSWHESAKIKEQLEKKNFAYLQTLRENEIASTWWLRFDLHSCSHCKDLNVLSVYEVSLEVNDKGETKEVEKSIINNLLVSRQENELIRNTKLLPATPPENKTNVGESVKEAGA